MKNLILLALVVGGCGGAAKKPETKPEPKPEAGSGSGSAVAEPKPEEPPKPAGDAWCANRPETFGPFILDETLAKQRHGLHSKTYADADSTKEKPVEVCGIPAARAWLEQTKCPDGSVGNQLGRVGNVGPGGRCGAIIDKYKVACPDGSINVFIDVYMCGPGESM